MVRLGEGIGGLGWTFVDAIGKDSDEVGNIETWVKDRSVVVEGILKGAEGKQDPDSPESSTSSSSSTASPLVQALFPPNPPTNADSWSASPFPINSNASFQSPFINHHLSPSTLTSITRMKPLPWTSSTGMIACWYSHYQIIRRFAEEWGLVKNEGGGAILGGGKRENALLILEDDVDMELDAEEILDGLLGEKKLPEDWDILYLGESCLFVLPPQLHSRRVGCLFLLRRASLSFADLSFPSPSAPHLLLEQATAPPLPNLTPTQPYQPSPPPPSPPIPSPRPPNPLASGPSTLPQLRCVPTPTLSHPRELRNWSGC